MLFGTDVNIGQATMGEFGQNVGEILRLLIEFEKDSQPFVFWCVSAHGKLSSNGCVRHEAPKRYLAWRERV